MNDRIIEFLVKWGILWPIGIFVGTEIKEFASELVERIIPDEKIKSKIAAKFVLALGAFAFGFLVVYIAAKIGVLK